MQVSISLLLLSTFSSISNANLLSGLLQRVTQTVSSFEPSTSTRAEEPEKISAFLEWFVNNGGNVDPAITLQNFPGYGNGIAALEPVKQLQTIYTVSPDMIFSRLKVIEHYSSSAPDAMATMSSAPTDDHVIASQLIVECSLGDASLFKPYMDILPEEVPTLEFFTPEELREFQDDRFVALQEDAKTWSILRYSCCAILREPRHTVSLR